MCCMAQIVGIDGVSTSGTCVPVIRFSLQCFYVCLGLEAYDVIAQHMDMMWRFYPQAHIVVVPEAQMAIEAVHIEKFIAQCMLNAQTKHMGNAWHPGYVHVLCGDKGRPGLVSNAQVKRTMVKNMQTRLRTNTIHLATLVHTTSEFMHDKDGGSPEQMRELAIGKLEAQWLRYYYIDGKYSGKQFGQDDVLVSTLLAETGAVEFFARHSDMAEDALHGRPWTQPHMLAPTPQVSWLVPPT